VAYLFFPGRHVVNTRFQEEYLLRVLGVPLSRLAFAGTAPRWSGEVNTVVFAVTSANRQNSRYNPVPFHIRAIGVDRMARGLADALDISHRILGIPHFPPTPRFAHHVLRDVQEQTEGELDLTPDNTVVLCSTPAVIAQFAALGYSVLPAELGEPEDRRPPMPFEIVQRIAALDGDWSKDPDLRRILSPATLSLWHDFPQVPHRVARLFRDPLLTEQGDLTATRDYASYGRAMSDPKVIEFKYRDVAECLVEGKIVDEGCADGALLIPIARDCPDSDLIGIEITGEFLAQCHERQRRGDFGGSFVHFHQRNLQDVIFELRSIDTTLCNSTTHELWSYGDGVATLRPYLERKFAQTRAGGRLVIRDVLGPEQKDREVYLWCSAADGSNEDPLREIADGNELVKHLERLSTAARFRRFAQDFLAAERASNKRGAESAIAFRQETVGDRTYFVLRLKDAAEFLSKKDYADNWHSEMHEEFTFWSFSEWKAELTRIGFKVIETPADPAGGSRAYVNPWIVENRFRGKAELFEQTPAGLAKIDYPPTNMVLVGQRD